MLRWIVSLLLCACCTGAVQAADPVSREQALRNLADAQAPVRRAAVVRLAEVGRIEDAKALLPRLKDSDGEVREAAELALWAVWSRSGDERIDALLAHGALAMNGGHYEQALADFNRVIKQRPDFAEGWNKRATLYFLAGDVRHSLADCAEVIKRNPSHFGALSGYGQLYLRLDDPEKALGYFERAYAINPGMSGVAANIAAIRQALERQRRKMI
ncbi:MAG TPA: tetratricopeptide repeat protein [Burkholderiales bacterium]|jgi:tetratricopeptide (TPR) repeat protein